MICMVKKEDVGKGAKPTDEGEDVGLNCVDGYTMEETSE